MRAAVTALLAMLTACDGIASPPPPAMPWIHGMTRVAAGAIQTTEATRRMSLLAAVSPEDQGGAIELRADLTGDGAVETVLASYSGGVLMVDRGGRVAARAAGRDAEGSADDLLAIAVGDIQIGAPALLVATQSGGHRESTVTLAVYRPSNGALRAMFAAPIERHIGDATQAGAVLFVRDGLWYRAPDADAQTYWVLDRRRGAYVARAPSLDDAPRVGSGPST